MLQQRDTPYLNRETIEKTYASIARFIRRTPVLSIAPDAFGLGDFSLAFKLELLQATGSFKARGAFANMLLRGIPPGGVTAASGGNHGAAVAYAAQRLGAKCTIFVWSQASQLKRERIRSFGADLRVVGDTYSEALAATEQFAREHAAFQVQAFDAVETLLGAGSIGLELDDQLPHVDTVLVPVGGGGLLCGVAAWFGADARVIGIEPERAPTMTRALSAGKPVIAESASIASDSLGPDHVSELTLETTQRLADRILLVSDDDIRKAQNELWNATRILAEPAGAAAFAALLSAKYVPQKNERVAVVLTGGNAQL